MESLPVQKIYLDSSHRVNTAFTSSSDFTVELPRNVYFHEYTNCCVSDITIPFSWRTIDENVNDKLYVRMSIMTATGGLIVIDAILKLSSNIYDGLALGNELINQLKNAYNTSMPPVELAKLPWATNMFLVASQDDLSNRITIRWDRAKALAQYPANCLQLRIFTDNEMKKMRVNNAIFANKPSVELSNNMSVFGQDFNKFDLQSANAIIGNLTRSYNSVIDIEASNKAKSAVYQDMTTGFLNLMRYSHIYIASEDLSSFNTMGINGECSILKKVPVTVTFGSIIVDQTYMRTDSTDVTGKNLRQIRFRLIDSDGKLVNLNGADWSMSLVFNNN